MGGGAGAEAHQSGRVASGALLCAKHVGEGPPGLESFSQLLSSPNPLALLVTAFT